MRSSAVAVIADRIGLLHVRFRPSKGAVIRAKPGAEPDVHYQTSFGYKFRPTRGWHEESDSVPAVHLRTHRN